MSILSFEQEDSFELHIARDYYNSPLFRNKPDHPDSFLSCFVLAFLRADAVNFELLRPITKQLIQKYDLKCTCEEKRET